MVLLGTLANVAAIIAGALVGQVLSGIPEGIKKTVMHGLGLACCFLLFQSFCIRVRLHC